MTAMVRVAVALLLGLLVAFALAAAPEAWRLIAVRLLEPVGTLWVNAIRMIVLPLVVALLVVGIASASDTRQIGRLGLRAVATFYSLLAAVAILIALVAPPLFAGLRLDPTRVAALRANAAGADALTAQVPSFRDWLVSLVPTNPIGAAAEGALLPLIVFVIAFGFAMTRVDAPEREHVVGFFRAVNHAMLVLARWVLAMAPIGVFALAFVLGNQLGTGAVGALGFYLIVQVGLSCCGNDRCLCAGGARGRRSLAAVRRCRRTCPIRRAEHTLFVRRATGNDRGRDASAQPACEPHRVRVAARRFDLSPDVTDQLDCWSAIYRSALWDRDGTRANRHRGCRFRRLECYRPRDPQRRLAGSSTRVCRRGATRGRDRNPDRRRPDSRPIQDDPECHGEYGGCNAHRPERRARWRSQFPAPHCRARWQGCRSGRAGMRCLHALHQSATCPTANGRWTPNRFDAFGFL